MVVPAPHVPETPCYVRDISTSHINYQVKLVTKFLYGPYKNLVSFHGLSPPTQRGEKDQLGIAKATAVRKLRYNDNRGTDKTIQCRVLLFITLDHN